MKLLAIDGNSIINRAFYGIKLLSTKDGRYTNAVYGFINILNRLLETEKPDGVAVAFDLHAPTFRHKKYDAYKAGRRPTPPELLSQFPVLKSWLTLAGYTCIECEGFEADDILGTLSLAAEKSGGKDTCVIATGDRDSLQLVSDSTRVLLTVTKMGRPEITDYTPEKLFEKYGLTPPEMIELKSLMGDSSDNIPGVAGIGEKTATDLITKYHSIDYIYENLDSLEIKDGVRKKLAEGKQSAFDSRWLGTICRTAPIDTELSHYTTRRRDENGLAALMTELEFFKLMEKMNIHPSAVVSTDEAAPVSTLKICDLDIGKVKNSVCLYADESGFAAVYGGCVSVCDDDAAKAILENADIEKTVYESKPLYKRFDKAENICFDARLAGYLCNPASNDYSLERMAQEYAARRFETSSDDPLIKNAALLFAVCERLSDTLEEIGAGKLLREIEIPLSRVLAEMESAGFLVDRDGLKEEGEELSKQAAAIETDIFTLAGESFNINSPKQLGVILFEKLGLPCKKKTKSGYSTSADVLEGLRFEYPIVDLVLKYRQLTKLRSTYCDGLLAAADDNGRIHSTFNQTEARTGRISSLEPNLQNIPVRTEEGRKLRRFFKAPDGYVLCDADYSQIELRVLASIADDKEMIKAFESGIDIHTNTASQVFDIPVDMVLPIMRSRAKAVNFGIVYGIGAFSLAKDIGVSRAEADRYIKGYLATYKGVDSYMKNVIEQAKHNGYVVTEFGRRRYLPELSSSNHAVRAFGERAARNAPIQGTAADIIKIAMIRVNDRLKKELPKARLILQVHDELIVECPENDAERVCKILEEEMENAAHLKVRLSVDAHSGKTWLEAKG